MAKRVLVTGGAGFIPSNFIHHLLAKTPYEVVSLDALTYAGNLDNLSGAMSHERLSFVHGDIRDVELVRDVVSEVDVIVNAAAESHVEKSIDEGAREFVTTNVEGTQILLDAVREAPVANVVLAAVRKEEEGQASGAQNAIRELGGVFGVAVLASVWSNYGSYRTGASFVHGMTPAIWIGAAVVLLGAVASFAIPYRRRSAEAVAGEPAYAEAA
jgi:nucleoside-diphosphate-sugar epimerase